MSDTEPPMSMHLSMFGDDPAVAPKMWSVVIVYDECIPTQFIISMLVNIFKFPFASASVMAVDLRSSQKVIAGAYPFDIADSKIHRASMAATEAGIPLRLFLHPYGAE